MLQPGIHRARVAGSALALTKTGKEQLAISFEVVEGLAQGERITAYLFFTDAAWPYTEKALREALGWDPNADALDFTRLHGDASEILGAECEIDCQPEEYNGVQRTKVRWISAIGGGAAQIERMDDTQARAFSTTLAARLRATGAVRGTPVPSATGYKRSKKHSDFAGSADYGRCVSRNLKYFGYKLVTVCTLHGLPIVYELVPANTDERLAAETVIEYFSFCDFFADKGFLGWKWQTQILDQTNNLIWTPRRSNKHYQNAPSLDRWLSSIRERIEGVFHEVQNTGRNLERLLAKTVLGLCPWVISKMTSHP